MALWGNKSIMGCGFGCHPWNKLPEVVTRATDSPCKVLGVGESTLGLGELLWSSIWGR